jgi:hypothetical protein
LSWADGGAPSGVLKAEESVPPVFVPAAPTWDHGQPDLVIPVGAGHKIASGAPFHLQRFVVETNLPASQRVRAIALKQGDRRVVRHAAFYEAATGRWIGGWTPWQTSSQLAGDVAIPFSAKGRLVVEVGYTGTDQDVIDRSEVGLYFADASAATADALNLSSRETAIAARTTSQRVRTETKLSADTRLLAFWPNPGEGARSVEIAAVSPEGVMTPLLWINQYRAEWRSPYLLASGVDLAQGTRVIMTTYFDNSADRELVVTPQTWVITAAPSRPGAARRK